MTTKVTFLPNGPLMIEGNPLPTIQDSKGQIVDTTGKDKLFLCRCGHSNNKPFCDSSHKAKDFKAN
jgi:CDGSH-type Zn-finger protein